MANEDKRIIEQTATESIFNDDWLIKDSPTNGTTKIQPSVLKAWINDGMATVEELEIVVGNIADTYNTSESYVVDDLCIHEYALYKCIGATTGTWDSTKWQATTLAEIIATIDLSAEAISYNNTSSGLEAENVQDAIDETITKLSAVGSASGAIATFADGSDLPMPSLKVAIEPQQDLHGYDSPWVGGSGKNKCDLSAFTHTGVVDDEGGETTLNNRLFSVHIPVKSGTTYTLSLTGSKNGENIYANRIIYFDSNDTFIKRYTPAPQIQTASFTTLSNAKYIQIDLRTASLLGIEITDISKIQVEEGDSATAYEPYSNICPIIGWDEANVTVVGKNIFGGLPLANAIVNAGGTLDTVNKTVSFTHGNSQVNILENIKLKDNTKYTFILTYSNAGNNNSLSLFYKTSGSRYPINLNNSSDTKTTIVYTTSAVTIDKLVLGWVLDANTNIYYEESGLFEGELTASDFEAYNGHTYTIDLDGTRYGGTLDVVSGVLTIDRASVDLGTLYWSYSTADVRFFTTSIQDIKKVMDSTIVMNGLCSHYDIVAYQYVHKSTALDGVMGLFSTSTTNYLAIKDTRYTDATSFKTAMDGVQLVYELATPQTYQLTPTQVKSLLGVNNIWADTGDVDVEYIRDMTTIINSLIARIEALENQ